MVKFPSTIILWPNVFPFTAPKATMASLPILVPLSHLTKYSVPQIMRRSSVLGVLWIVTQKIDMTASSCPKRWQVGNGWNELSK
jgi:hypothetical protein